MVESVIVLLKLRAVHLAHLVLQDKTVSQESQEHRETRVSRVRVEWYKWPTSIQ